MAQTSTLTIKLNGVPLDGAEVFSSDALSEKVTTDANGQITASLPDDYAACVLVAIRHSALPYATFVAVCVLESGEDYEINIPAIASAEYPDLYGIHAPHMRKV